MYKVMWNNLEAEEEYLFDAESVAASLPGSVIINLETGEEEGE